MKVFISIVRNAKGTWRTAVPCDWVPLAPISFPSAIVDHCGYCSPRPGALLCLVVSAEHPGALKRCEVSAEELHWYDFDSQNIIPDRVCIDEMRLHPSLVLSNANMDRSSSACLRCHSEQWGARTRGLCNPCYKLLGSRVRNGDTTWERLQAEGVCYRSLTAQQAGARGAAITAARRRAKQQQEANP